MKTDLDLETKVIERFVVKHKRDRYLAFVQNERSRKKFLAELAHFGDLRTEEFDRLAPPERKGILRRVAELGDVSDCYVISENSRTDGKRMPVDLALNETIGYGMGTFLVFGDANVVYFESEETNDRCISRVRR